MFRHQNQSRSSVGSNQGLLQENNHHHNNNQFGYMISEKDKGYLQTSLDVLNTAASKKKRTVHQKKFHEFNERNLRLNGTSPNHPQYLEGGVSPLHTNSFTQNDANAFYQQQLQKQQHIIQQYNQQQQQQQQQSHHQHPQRQLRSPPLSATLQPQPHLYNVQGGNPSRLSISTTQTGYTADRMSTVDRDELIERLMTENSGLHQQLSENEIEMQRLFQENENLKLNERNQNSNNGRLMFTGFDSPLGSSSRNSLMEEDDWMGQSYSVPTDLSAMGGLDPKMGALYVGGGGEDDEEEDSDRGLFEEEEEEEDDTEILPEAPLNLPVITTTSAEDSRVKPELKEAGVQTSAPVTPVTMPTITPTPQKEPIVKPIIKPTEDLVSDLLATIRSLKLQNSHLSSQKSQIEEKLSESKRVIKKIATDSISLGHGSNSNRQSTRRVIHQRGASNRKSLGFDILGHSGHGVGAAGTKKKSYNQKENMADSSEDDTIV